MSGEPELDAMTTVLSALRPLDGNAQGRVLRWVIEKLELPTSFSGTAPRESANADAHDTHKDAGPLPQAAKVWMRQNEITAAELEHIFHHASEEVAVIASDIPGKSRPQQVINCYMLAGVCELLRTGEPTFSDKAARSLCDSFGCLDTTNHSKYLNTMGNEFTGSKEKGWTLTAPGKKRAAALVKEIASVES